MAHLFEPAESTGGSPATRAVGSSRGEATETRPALPTLLPTLLPAASRAGVVVVVVVAVVAVHGNKAGNSCGHGHEQCGLERPDEPKLPYPANGPYGSNRTVLRLALVLGPCPLVAFLIRSRSFSMASYVKILGPFFTS